MAIREVKISELTNYVNPAEDNSILQIVIHGKNYHITLKNLLSNLEESKEDTLPNPPAQGFLLTSDSSGNRSWDNFDDLIADLATKEYVDSHVSTGPKFNAYYYTANADQEVFTGTDNYENDLLLTDFSNVQVYVQGSFINPKTVTMSGTSITFPVGITLGLEVTILEYK